MKKLIAILLCTVAIIGTVPLFSSAVFEGDDKIVVVLDPGHGGVNVGTARNGIGEKTMTMKLAQLLKTKLEENGNFTVYMTRDGDYDLPLAKRGIVANDYNGDILVSLHFDGSTYYDRGVSVITSVLPEYEMADLARMVCNSINAKTGLPIKGVIQRKDTEGYYWNAEKQWDCKDPSLGTLSDYYGIPTWAAKFGMGSILIEHGFFTNDADAAIIFAEGGIEKLAEADAEAIISYYTNHTHTYEASPRRDFPSNCMFQGKQSQHCTTCGHRKNITYLAEDTDNHYWINETSQAPKCGVDGYVKKECRITLNLNEKDVECENHTEVTYIEAKPHSYYVSDQREVSHAVDGYYQYTCSNCGHTYKEVIKSEGHSWTATERTEPTCSAEGKITYYCETCSEYKYETLPALGHRLWMYDFKESDCTEDGYKKYTCSVCSENIEETIPALGHDNQIVTLARQTCTEDGRIQTFCNRCGHEDTEVTEKTGHKMELVSKVDASCTEDGYTEHKCSVCDHTEKTTFTATDHSYNTTVTKEAAFFHRGEKTASCANCQDTYTEAIPSTWDSPAAKLICIGSVVLLAAICAAAVIFIIKKKKSAPAEEAEAEKEADVPVAAAAEAEAEETEAEAEAEAETEAEAEPEPVGSASEE